MIYHICDRGSIMCYNSQKRKSSVLSGWYVHFIKARSIIHYQLEETRHPGSLPLHPNHCKPPPLLPCMRPISCFLIANLILHSNPHSYPCYEHAHLLLFRSQHPRSLPFFSHSTVSSLVHVGTFRQEKIVQRLETEDLRCLGWLWDVRVMGGCREERWIPWPVSSPPSHCSWAGAARQLSVPATSDRCLLSVSLRWSTICAAAIWISYEPKKKKKKSTTEKKSVFFFIFCILWL